MKHVVETINQLKNGEEVILTFKLDNLRIHYIVRLFNDCLSFMDINDVSDLTRFYYKGDNILQIENAVSQIALNHYGSQCSATCEFCVSEIMKNKFIDYNED